MRRFLLAALCFVPVLAFGQGVTRQIQIPDLIISVRPAALTAAVGVGSFKLGRAVRVTRIEGQLSTVGGGGAGNTVLTFTDGTNTCTATLACVTSGAGANGHVVFTVANGAGTGCNYAATATVTGSVTTAGCTTTQPTINVMVSGKVL